MTRKRQLPLPTSPRPPEPAASTAALEAFVAALVPPLRYLATAPPDAAARTRWPSEIFATRALALARTMTDPPVRAALEDLAAVLRSDSGAAPTADAERAQRAFALLQRLMRSGGSAPENPTYRMTTHDVAPDLLALAESVQFVHGVGPRRAEALRKFGIVSVEDLLYHLPFRYEDRRAVTPIRSLRVGDVASVMGVIVHLAERAVGRAQRRVLEGSVRDDTGLLLLTWYHQVTYFRGRYQVGQRCLVHGKVEGGPRGEKRMVHPEIDTSAELESQGVLPVYNKPTTMSVGSIRAMAQRAAADWADRVPSVLPPAIVKAAGITDLPQALRMLHRPGRDVDVAALNAARSLGHRSLVFDELFFLQLGMALRRRSVELESGLTMPPRQVLTPRLERLLPFRLTGAQRRTIQEILRDMAKPHPMHRLVQGDVGSGKTIVALFAALVAIENGYQAAFMAPTELLAEQHFGTISRFVTGLGVETVLLTGEVGGRQRRAVYERLARGEIQLVVGTHALIQQGVVFHKIGVGIIDEQHRFGVLQRAALRRLGGTPDILLMTATPIPRTLAMAVYGDLDISVLDELPAGRRPVRTLLRHEGERARVYDLVRHELEAGRQGYVVYPLVDNSDESELRDATTMAQELARQVFHQYRVGLIHGKMKGAEKDAIMRRFKAGDVQLLVSTTVIEVGIDVPNASVIVIEHADRFGLAQLHQLRGRVGRGDAPACCVLVTPFHRGEEAFRRLEALAATSDGFRIAEIDLELRGPGELLGTRQSGLPEFRVANLIRDQHILADARRAADECLRLDPRLERSESQALRKVLVHRWAGRLELAEIG